jgi:hypothetical protein
VGAYTFRSRHGTLLRFWEITWEPTHSEAGKVLFLGFGNQVGGPTRSEAGKVLFLGFGEPSGSVHVQKHPKLTEIQMLLEQVVS